MTRKTGEKPAGGSEEGEIASFEAALGELEKLVERMERGDQSLEDALRDFERGVELTRTCQKRLQEAEQRVEKLVSDEQGQERTEPFSPDE